MSMHLKKCVGGLATLVCAGVVSTASAAFVVTDDFNTSHDYSGKNVTGTIWDGVMINDGTHATQNAVVTTANANTSNAGQLTLVSHSGSWEHAEDDGFFLFRNVSGDFTATIQVISVNQTNWHDTGLMARVADVSLAGPGEDYVAARYFPNANGNILRSTDDGNSPARTQNTPLRAFLKLERVGNVFTYTAASNAAFTANVSTDSVTRNDLDGLPLQVGIWQATFSTNVGTAVFDNFSLTYVPEPSTVVLSLAGLACVGLRRRARVA
jgi:regulation of enolase protein 1 (concanavalin A-like superfamily)